MQFGHSKDDPDRPQFKIAAAVLDPLGMPLATAVVPGNATDDPLYVPAIQAVQQSLGVGGRTYVGDCKMAALATRAFVAAGGDFYLCPLSENQLSRAERQRVVAAGVGRHAGVAAGVATRPRGAAGRTGGGGVRGGRGVDRDGGRAGGAVDGAPLAGAFAGVRAGPGGGPGASAGDGPTAALRELVVRKQGKKQLFHAELMEAAEAIVTREGVEGLLSYTVRAVMTTRHEACVPGPPGAAGDGGVVRDRGASGRGGDRGEEAGDGLAGLRDECRWRWRCRRWCGRTGASIGSRTTGRG